jgi:hypothetical protein
MFKSSVAQGQVLGGSRALLSKTQDTALESQGVNFVSIVEGFFVFHGRFSDQRRRWRKLAFYLSSSLTNSYLFLE